MQLKNVEIGSNRKACVGSRREGGKWLKQNDGKIPLFRL